MSAGSTQTVVLHAAWPPSNSDSPERLALWAEVASHSGSLRRRRALLRNGALPPHPFSANKARLDATYQELMRGVVGGAAGHARLVAWLPSSEGRPVSSPELPAGYQPGADDCVELLPWRVDALTLDAAQAVKALLWAGEGMANGILAGDDLQFWLTASRFALALLSHQRFLPALEASGGELRARWQVPLDQDDDRERLGALARSMPPACRSLSWDDAAPQTAPRLVIGEYLAAVVDALAREALRARHPAAPKHSKRQPGHRGGGTAARAWIEALAAEPDLAGKPAGLNRLLEQYQSWIAQATAPATAADSFRICFRLLPPEDGRDWALEYLLQATDDPSLLVSASEVWRRRGSTARFLDRRFDNPQERLLAGLGRASRVFAPIAGSLQAATPAAASLTVRDAYGFVSEGALLLQSSGFGVLVPGLQTKLGVRLKLSGGDSRTARSVATSTLTWDSLVGYDWQLAIGDETVSREEFEALARLKQPLVQVRGRWIELRPDQVAAALRLFQTQEVDAEIPLKDALRLALAPDGEAGLPVVGVETTGWLDQLLEQLKDSGKREALEEPPDFDGLLRPYQKAGLTWLAALSKYGIGACLADDMGLGKTVQMIALLLHQRARAELEAAGPTLLICPTSVVGNWRHELARFAPGLRVLIHHGAGRTRDELASEAGRHDIVISTYALLHRDEPELTAVDWANVVLDEAQNIKNSSTRSAQAARKLRARWRVAMTGTPIENRLSDLWSLFHFLDPGYLGASEEFHRRFVLPIERAGDSIARERLKTLISPMILRRLKTDPSIIDDLPEKNEMKVFCSLTQEQATLYEATVQSAIRAIEESEGIQRRGLVLSMLAQLKQLCNHPALFLKDKSSLSGRSGKLTRLEEMIEEVLALGDRALIFTQYAQMGTILREHLQSVTGQEALFLHGGTPAAARDRMVARFQDERGTTPLFVLSLKAGGTGLNLTRANHVFHFDRWWNPAVENQATDRAFRIGQRRDVQVHKFVCAGTFEEAIDALIERKVALAESIVGASEAWITEMSTDDLRNIFALRRETAEVG